MYRTVSVQMSSKRISCLDLTETAETLLLLIYSS